MTAQVKRKKNLMPIPQNQLDQLNADLQNHELRLASLKTAVADMQSEIEVHNAVLQLARDPKIHTALGDVHDNPALADQMSKDPQGFVQSRGIHLPAGTTIKVSKPSSQSAAVSANFQIGRFRVGLQYDSVNGFSSLHSS